MKKILLFMFLALVPFTTSAQGYAGFSFGQSNTRDGCNEIRDALGSFSLSTSCDDTNSAWSPRIGYRFHPNFSFEAFYLSLGDVQIDALMSDGFRSVLVDATAETSGFGANLSGYIPVADQLSLLGQTGILLWDLRLRATATAGSSSMSETLRESGLDPFIGLGAELHVSDRISLRGIYHRYMELDFESVSAGIIVNL